MSTLVSFLPVFFFLNSPRHLSYAGYLHTPSVGASLAIFLGFTVSGIHLGFSTLSLQAVLCLLCNTVEPC
jgi:hypothetical protein